MFYDLASSSSRSAVEAPKKVSSFIIQFSRIINVQDEDTQQARADREASMRVKAANAIHVPREQMLIVFVNVVESGERFACILSKTWTINRCKFSVAEQCALSNSNELALYSSPTLDAALSTERMATTLRDGQEVFLM